MSMNTDRLSPSERSALMARIRAQDTRPELRVRSLLHRNGYRYRLHARDLPGRPDIVFRRRRKVVFVHGCYWHRHPGCPRVSFPSTHIDYWRKKFEANRIRDAAVASALHDMGWSMLVVWECEIRRDEELVGRLHKFLGPPRC